MEIPDSTIVEATSSRFYWKHTYQNVRQHVQTSAGLESNCSDQVCNRTVSTSGCLVLLLEEFIPWDNPDNIVSFETEDLTRALKDLIFLPALFLIGCPANIINMVVFYKQGLKERINVCLFALSFADGMYMINNMVWFAEQLYLRFTTKETHGLVLTFSVNNCLIGFHGFIWVSQVLSAIIASERCFCILQPLRSQTVLRTSTTTAIIVIINVVVLALVFLATSRYHIVCAYDPSSEREIKVYTPSEFYLRNKMLIDYLDFFLLGFALPGVVVIVVVSTTIITAIKLQQAAAWRAGTSNSSASGLSERDIALTKMLVANSLFFIVCVSPFIVFRFFFYAIPEMNTGRRHHNFFFMIQWVLMIVSYFNATFNIVIYYTMGSRYRQIFWQLFGKQPKKKSSGVKTVLRQYQ